MQFELLYSPAHTLSVATLEAGESVRAESGAMVSMSSNISLTTDGPLNRKTGGLFGSLKRVLLSGETFFTNTFTAQSGRGEVTLAPSLTGDMAVHDLGAHEALYIQGSSFMAAPDTVRLDTRWQGFKGFFSGENLFFLEAKGTGPVLMNAFGAIETIDFQGELVVDTGHLVAFTSGITYEVSTASPGLLQSFLSGEGFVLRLRGQGKLYLQSRNPNEFGTSVGRLLPPRRE
jgi:uncharacterized protein (TIGR00266 family)